MVLALVQSWASRWALQGASRRSILGSRPVFLASTVITLTGGTLFLMWLGEQITSRGIGNGSSLAHHLRGHRRAPSGDDHRRPGARPTGALSPVIILGVAVAAVALVYFIVFMERAQRRILINYPKRQVGNRMYEGQTSFLPLKLNTSGVIPPIFASSLLLLPATAASFSRRTTAAAGSVRSRPISATARRCSWRSTRP